MKPQGPSLRATGFDANVVDVGGSNFDDDRLENDVHLPNYVSGRLAELLDAAAAPAQAQELIDEQEQAIRLAFKGASERWERRSRGQRRNVALIAVGTAVSLLATSTGLAAAAGTPNPAVSIVRSFFGASSAKAPLNSRHHQDGSPGTGATLAAPPARSGRLVASVPVVSCKALPTSANSANMRHCRAPTSASGGSSSSVSVSTTTTAGSGSTDSAGGPGGAGSVGPASTGKGKATDSKGSGTGSSKGTGSNRGGYQGSGGGGKCGSSTTTTTTTTTTTSTSTTTTTTTSTSTTTTTTTTTDPTGQGQSRASGAGGEKSLCHGSGSSSSGVSNAPIE